MFDLRSLSNMRITVEPLRRKNFIIQCFRCQSYVTVRHAIETTFQCAKCRGEHISAICSKPKFTPIVCGLCDGQHEDIYKGCQVYQNLQARKNPVSTTIRETPSIFGTLNAGTEHEYKERLFPYILSNCMTTGTLRILAL